VYGFLGVLYPNLSNLSNVNKFFWYNTSGGYPDLYRVSENAIMIAYYPATYGQPGDDDRGIVLGTDNTAVTASDYQLGTQIAHGSGAGQLEYGGMGGVPPYEKGSNWEMQMYRPFVNASGGGITVEEIGIYTRHYEGDFMICHDLKNFTINDGESAAVEYLLQTTV
jgi:hypothetical protein